MIAGGFGPRDSHFSIRIAAFLIFCAFGGGM
jgi:hypothetical protein